MPMRRQSHEREGAWAPHSLLEDSHLLVSNLFGTLYKQQHRLLSILREYLFLYLLVIVSHINYLNK